MPGKLPGTRKNKNLAEFSKREQERVQLMISKEFSFIYNFDRGCHSSMFKMVLLVLLGKIFVKVRPLPD